MSRYKAYQEYKDSGVDWLGGAPSHWTTLPVGRLYQRTKRTNYADKELLSVYRDHGVVPTASRDDNNNKPSEDLTAYQLVEPDNLVVASRTIIWPLMKQLWMGLVPFLHGLHRRFALER